MKKISVQAIRCAALVLFLIGAAYADDPPPPPIPPKPLRGTLVDPDAPPPAPPRVSLPPAAPGVAPDVSSPPGCRTRMVGQSTSGLGLAGGIEVEFPAGGCANAWTARSPSSFHVPAAGLAESPAWHHLVS